MALLIEIYDTNHAAT